MVIILIFRLTLWFLLTANLSLANILIGITIALLLPQTYPPRERLEDLFKGILKIIMAIPQAYAEAIELMLNPHTQEVIVHEPVKPGRSPGQIFLDIFLITFTPKSIVLNYTEGSDVSYDSRHDSSQDTNVAPNNISSPEDINNPVASAWYSVHYVTRRGKA